MATTDEFTFPVITDTYSCTIDSPPLWRLSPAASPDSAATRNSEGQEEEDCFPGKLRGRKSCSDCKDDEEEKMDILWEDFNEELSSSGKRSSSGDMVDLGCTAQALKLSRSTGGSNTIFSPRKPGLVVFIKVLKKLFLLHNSHNSHRRSSGKNRPW